MSSKIWLWVGLVLMLVLACNVTVYAFVARTFQERLDRQLESVAQHLPQSVGTVSSPSSDKQVIQLPDLDPFTSPGTYVQVVNTDGSGVSQSPNLLGDYLAVPPQVLKADCSSGKRFFDAQFRDSAVRVLSVPLYDARDAGSGNCKPLGAMQVVSPLSDVRHDLGLLRDMLLAFGGAEVFLLVAGIVWFRSKNGSHLNTSQSLCE